MLTNATLESGDLVLRRSVVETPDVVWATLTDSDRLSRWFGTWTGDPSTGSVDVTMNAEPDSDQLPATPYAIIECEAPLMLMVRSDVGEDSWTLSVQLIPEAVGTNIVLRHHDIPTAMIGDIGPGWDWYLDRLVAALAGAEPPSLEDFDRRYLPEGPRYRALLT